MGHEFRTGTVSSGRLVVVMPFKWVNTCNLNIRGSHQGLL